MRNLFLALFSLCFLTMFAQDESEYVDIPLTLKSGDPEFSRSVSVIFAQPLDSSERTVTRYRNLTGLPPNWSDETWSIQSIPINVHQLFYQKFKHGQMTEERFSDVYTSYKMDTTELYPMEVDCMLYYLVSKSEEGCMQVIVDVDNDLDFADERLFSFCPGTGHDEKAPGRSQSEEISFRYEYVLNREVKEDSGTFRLYADSLDFGGGRKAFALLMKEYGYAEGTFKGTTFYFNSDVYAEQVTPYGRIFYADTDSTYESVQQGLIVKALNKPYIFDSVIEYPPALRLRLIKVGEKTRIAQEGYYLPRFAGTDVMTGDSISSEGLEGKYVFIDVWGSWCSPCIFELPNIKAAYETLDPEQIAFIAIGQDQEPTLIAAIEEHEVPWPNILSNYDNNITEDLNISSYPTTFLVDPEGKIIAMNLRGENLAELIQNAIDRNE